MFGGASLAGEPAYVPGNFIHAIRSMPCTF